MKVNAIGVLGDESEGERRVPLVPEGARRLARSGLTVLVEHGAGSRAWYPDQAYVEAGAAVAPREEVVDKGDILLSLSRPSTPTLSRLRAGQTLIGMLGLNDDPGVTESLGRKGVIAVTLERLPRTVSRAQSMDVLTSQASVAGYKAVLVAADAFGRYFPMLITAAGTSRPARVLVLGAGVAGLSAIGTARRLGAVVTGYDVRPETREEVQSLGAKFLAIGSVESAVGEGGYARALTPEEARAQQLELQAQLPSFDVVITTAAVPSGRPPLLIPSEALSGMKSGSVVIDMASGPNGGNVEGSVPDESVATPGGVILVGAADLAAKVPTAASDAFSQNMLAVINLLVRDGELLIDLEDEVQAAIVVSPAARIQEGPTERVSAL